MWRWYLRERFALELAVAFSLGVILGAILGLVTAAWLLA
jgi:hypothetical protein